MFPQALSYNFNITTVVPFHLWNFLNCKYFPTRRNKRKEEKFCSYWIIMSDHETYPWRFGLLIFLILVPGGNIFKILSFLLRWCFSRIMLKKMIFFFYIYYCFAVTVVTGDSLETDGEVLWKLKLFLEGNNRANKGHYSQWKQNSSPCMAWSFVLFRSNQSYRSQFFCK